MYIDNAEYEACRKNMENLASWYSSNSGDRNEATTRLQLVDRLFFDCLGWSREERIELESEHNEDYADYVFTSEKSLLILEAKREGDDFEVAAGKVRLKYSLKGLSKDHPNLNRSITQVTAYCSNRGIPYAAICNGHQVIAFVAVRTDGTPPLEGQAFVFPSLDFMVEKFFELWQALSREGIQANNWSFANSG